MSNAVPKHLLVLADGTQIGSGQVGDNAIRSVSYTQTVADDTDLAPGAACACKLEIELWVQPGHALRITSGTEMTCYRLDAAGGREKIGVFRAVKPTKASRNTYKVYAYDAVSRLDGIQSTWLRSIQGQFPMSLWAFAQAVAARCGVTIANTALPANGSYQVQAFYADDLTGRQLLAWVAQASGTFLRANADGALEFAWYADRRDVVIGPGEGAAASTLLADATGALLQEADGYYLLAAAAADVDGVTPYYDGTLSYEDYTCAVIDKVQIRQSSDDVGVVFPADEAGTNALTIEGNLLLTTSTDAALRPVAQALYAQMQAVEYTPCTVRIPAAQAAALGLGAGQIVRVQDARGRVFDAWIMTASWSADGVTLESTGNASRDGSAATNQQIYKNLTGKMLEIRTSVDGLELKASELQGDYTELLITVDGLTSTVAGKIDGNQAQTLINQSLDSITLSAANGSESSTLTLKYGSTTLASAQITFNGLVNFVTQSDLSTAGQTTINGGNIKTGTISAISIEGCQISGGWVRSKRDDGTGAYVQDGTFVIYGTAGSSRLRISPDGDNSGNIDFWTVDGFFCGRIRAYKDGDFGRIQIDPGSNGFLGVDRIQTSEIACNGSGMYANNYWYITPSGSNERLAWMQSGDRVLACDMMNVDGSTRRLGWVYDDHISRYVLAGVGV